jgi:hypothetical protein
MISKQRYPEDVNSIQNFALPPSLPNPWGKNANGIVREPREDLNLMTTVSQAACYVSRNLNWLWVIILTNDQDINHETLTTFLGEFVLRSSVRPKRVELSNQI